MAPTSTNASVEKTLDAKENEEAASHESKRKQAHPLKTVEVPPKKRGRKRKLEETETASSSTTTTTKPTEEVAAKRGRPRKKLIEAESDVEDKSKKAEESLSDDQNLSNQVSDKRSPDRNASSNNAAPSKINSQLLIHPKVNVMRLNVGISPVKIVQEQPLMFEPTSVSTSVPTFVSTSMSTSVARKIKFPLETALTASTSDVSTADEKTSEDDEDEDDVIGSSQRSDSDSKRGKRKRKNVDEENSKISANVTTKRPSNYSHSLLSTFNLNKYAFIYKNYVIAKIQFKLSCNLTSGFYFFHGLLSSKPTEYCQSRLKNCLTVTSTTKCFRFPT